MATLHFMGGKPGAGKSTLARELGRTLPAIVICEDEWLETLGFQIESFEDYRDAARRCGQVMATFVPELLRQGLSVVLDVPANTVGARAWVRSLFESAGADHLLHWIDGSDDACLANVRRRKRREAVRRLLGAGLGRGLPPRPAVHRPPVARGGAEDRAARRPGALTVEEATMFDETHPILGTRDVRRAIDFYTRQLAFELLFAASPARPTVLATRPGGRASSRSTIPIATR
jgi:predicted kinase